MTRAECLAFERAVLALLGPGEVYTSPDGIAKRVAWLLPFRWGGDVQLTLFTDSNLPGRVNRASMLSCRSKDGKDSFDPLDFDLAARLGGIIASPYINEVSP